MMMAALYHMDRVDLNIAQMFDRDPCRLGSGSEWSPLIELLSTQPELPGPAVRHRMRRSLQHGSRNTERAA